MAYSQADDDFQTWPTDDTQLTAPQQRADRAERGLRRVFRDRVDTHWFADSTKFWYRNDLAGGMKEFVLVDADSGSRILL